jgi:hypothetical protein
MIILGHTHTHTHTHTHIYIYIYREREREHLLSNREVQQWRNWSERAINVSFLYLDLYQVTTPSFSFLIIYHFTLVFPLTASY